MLWGAIDKNLEIFKVASIASKQKKIPQNFIDCLYRVHHEIQVYVVWTIGETHIYIV